MNAQQQIEHHMRVGYALRSGKEDILLAAERMRDNAGLTLALTVLDNVKREIVKTAADRDGWIV